MIIYASGLLYNILNLKSNEILLAAAWLIVIMRMIKKDFTEYPVFPLSP